MLKHIIFDWDDTIVLGSREGYFKCYHETLVDLDIHLDPEVERERILSKWGNHPREELRALLVEHPEHLDEACTIYEDKVTGSTFMNMRYILEGTNKLLSYLSSKYTLSAITGSHPKNVESAFEKFDIPKVFSYIYTAYEKATKPELNKPNPYMVNLLLEESKISASDSIMVGDSKTDYEFAKNSKIPFIAVLTGNLTKESATDLDISTIIGDITFLDSIL